MEEWKDIEGYEGLYQVSNLGRVRSLDRIILKNGKYPAKQKGIILKQRTRNGYNYVGLSKGGNEKKLIVHRLIAKSFINNDNNKEEVNHKNGIKTDNRVCNIEWVSHSENGLHAYRELGRKPINKGKYGKLNHNSKRVEQYTIDNIFIRKRDSVMDIKRELGLNNAKIGQVCLGNRKTSGGYKRKYL